MKKKTTRKTGDDLEKKVSSLLDSSFLPTAGSGSVFMDGDFSHPNYVVECKVKNATEGISLSKSEFSKLKKEAKKQGKDWLSITENASNDIVVSMDINEFVRLFDLAKLSFKEHYEK